MTNINSIQQKAKLARVLISISTDCKKGNNDPIPSVSIHRDGEKCAMGDIITVTLNITVAIMQKEDVYA